MLNFVSCMQVKHEEQLYVRMVQVGTVLLTGIVLLWCAGWLADWLTGYTRMDGPAVGILPTRRGPHSPSSQQQATILYFPSVRHLPHDCHSLHIPTTSLNLNPMSPTDCPSFYHVPHRRCPYHNKYSGEKKKYKDEWVPVWQLMLRDAEARVLYLAVVKGCVT